VTCFTVDRKGTLTEGTVLDRSQPSVPVPDVQAHLRSLYPEGLTAHGFNHLIAPPPEGQANAQIELWFEWVRRAEFPATPSRYQSAFGCETIDNARSFRDHPTWGHAGSGIWEVEAEFDAFRADMACLKGTIPFYEVPYWANHYWSGKPSDNPSWELILTPPVRVLRRVE
jgi:hypothetical protein